MRQKNQKRQTIALRMVAPVVYVRHDWLKNSVSKSVLELGLGRSPFTIFHPIVAYYQLKANRTQGYRLTLVKNRVKTNRVRMLSYALHVALHCDASDYRCSSDVLMRAINYRIALKL